jgi:hypothetical protein
MTEVGGLFSQVEPEKIAIDCRQIAARLATP